MSFQPCLSRRSLYLCSRCKFRRMFFRREREREEKVERSVGGFFLDVCRGAGSGKRSCRNWWRGYEVFAALKVMEVKPRTRHGGND